MRSVCEGELIHDGFGKSDGITRSGEILTPSVGPTNTPLLALTGGQSTVGAVYHGFDHPAKGRITFPVLKESDPKEMYQKGLIQAAGLRETKRNLTVYDRASDPTPATFTYTFCIPLVSGVLGVQQGKYLPMGALAADLQLHLGIGNFEQAVKAVAVWETSGDTASYSPHDVLEKLKDIDLGKTHKFNITNMELELEYIEVASDVQLAIEAVTGGQYVMSFDSWNHYQNTLTANPGASTMLIGAKYSSMKDCMTIFRDLYKQNKAAFGGITARNNPFATTPNRPEFYQKHRTKFAQDKYINGVGWQYLIGSTHFPPKPVASSSEAFMEFQKAFHMLASQTRTGRFDAANWMVSARRDTNTTTSADGIPGNWAEYTGENGTFILSQNFESQSHKSHLAESGVNTLAQTMYMVARFPAAENVASNVFLHGATKAIHHGSEPTTTIAYTYKDTVVKDKADGTTDVDVKLWTETDTAVAGDTYSAAFQWTQGNQAMLVDHFVHYDGLLIISNGIASTRF